MHQRKAFLSLLKGKYAVMLCQIGGSGFVTPPALAVRVAHGFIGNGAIVLFGKEMVCYQHSVLALGLADYHCLPAVFLVEFNHCAVAGSIGHHIMITRADGGVVPYIHRFQQIQRFLNGSAFVQPETHDNRGSYVRLVGILLGSLLGEGHDGSAEALFVHAVHGGVN